MRVVFFLMDLMPAWMLRIFPTVGAVSFVFLMVIPLRMSGDSHNWYALGLGVGFLVGWMVNAVWLHLGAAEDYWREQQEQPPLDHPPQHREP